MRTAALIVPLVLLASGCFDHSERTYSFDKTLGCFRTSGFDVEQSAPFPDVRAIAVSEGNRLVYILTFHKTADRVKPPDPFVEEAAQAFGDTVGVEVTAEQRRNVTVFTQHGSRLPPTKPRDRATLERCLPKD